jgi:NAD(P)-dependent dehydrogenase (short-subunit alcohol dehydrogenase family)
MMKENHGKEKVNMQGPSKKIALITGANKGIGFEVARQLAKRACTVLVGSRDKKRGEEAAAKLASEDLDARYIDIDVTNPATIGAAAHRIAAEFGHLDILINNAGIADAADGSPTTSSPDAIEHIFHVNFVGCVAVTQAMLPLLRKAESARIVNVSSSLGSLGKNSDPAFAVAGTKYFGYSASKAALNMLTVQLAYVLRDTAIKVNSACPGYTATDLNHNQGTQTVQEGSEEIIRLALLGDDGPNGTYSDRNGLIPW